MSKDEVSTAKLCRRELLACQEIEAERDVLRAEAALVPDLLTLLRDAPPREAVASEQYWRWCARVKAALTRVGAP